MASSGSMLYRQLTGVVVLVADILMAFIGPMVLKVPNDMLMTTHFVPVLQDGASSLWWIFPFYYFVLLIFGIIAIVMIVVQPTEDTTYEQGGAY